MAQGATKNRVQSGRVKSMHLIQWTTSKVFSARVGVHRTIPWVQWYRYRYQQSTLWCTMMSWTIDIGGLQSMLKLRLERLRAGCFLTFFWGGCQSLKHTQISFFWQGLPFRIAHKIERFVIDMTDKTTWGNLARQTTQPSKQLQGM